MKKTEKAGEKLVHCYIAEFKGTEGLKKEEVVKCFSKVKINENGGNVLWICQRGGHW